LVENSLKKQQSFDFREAVRPRRVYFLLILNYFHIPAVGVVEPREQQKECGGKLPLKTEGANVCSCIYKISRGAARRNCVNIKNKMQVQVPPREQLPAG